MRGETKEKICISVGELATTMAETGSRVSGSQPDAKGRDGSDRDRRRDR
jgi:hypothetical protein